MTNPPYGQQALLRVATLIREQNLSKQQLQEIYTKLSKRYHLPHYRGGFISTAESLVYAAARLPATYAAVSRVLKELPADFTPNRLLDYGCGPGTATLACLDHFSSVDTLHLLDTSAESRALAKQLLPDTAEISNTLDEQKSYDLIILSYMTNELTPAQQQSLLKRLMPLCQGYLILIVPGTPKCFNELLGLRESIINAGYTIYAPCPHHLTCPMLGTTDWCHFSMRLPRSKTHQQLKDASLNYEDEKFSYLIMAKETKANSTRRIIKNPQHRSGHSLIDVCQEEGLERLVVSRKDGDLYQRAKSSHWGDCLD